MRTVQKRVSSSLLQVLPPMMVGGERRDDEMVCGTRY